MYILKVAFKAVVMIRLILIRITGLFYLEEGEILKIPFNEYFR